MAYLRKERKPSGTYLRIVEAVREGKKITQNILFNLGKVEDYTPEALQNIGKKLYEAGGGNIEDLLALEMVEESRQNYGYYLIFNKLFKEYQLDKLFLGLQKKHKLSFDLSQTVLLMVLERLRKPTSKKATYESQDYLLGVEKQALQHLYRSLDYLAESQAQIQQAIFEAGRDLFNLQLDVIFYDVTTFYFDSQLVCHGSLRQKGFSKDGKIGKTQVVLGMLIDKQKHPIAYQLYSGNTYEGGTLADSLEKLKKEYLIDKVIVVADRGLMSKQNILALTTDYHYEYIIGERLKSLPATLQNILLDLSGYANEWVMNEDKSLIIKHKTIIHEGKTIIGTWSAKRAEKDRKEREERLLKAAKLLKNSSSLQGKAAQYFIKNQAQSQWVLDEEKVKKQALYDGFLAISTNVTGIETATILDNYKHLFQIEHTFRSMKSFLETRPMFHWNDERIKGHICLCFIAYTLLQALIRKLAQADSPQSENAIRATLDSMQLSLLAQAGHQVYVRSKNSPAIHDMLKAMKINALPDMISKEHIYSYLT